MGRWLRMSIVSSVPRTPSRATLDPLTALTERGCPKGGRPSSSLATCFAILIPFEASGWRSFNNVRTSPADDLIDRASDRR